MPRTQKKRHGKNKKYRSSKKFRGGALTPEQVEIEKLFNDYENNKSKPTFDKNIINKLYEKLNEGLQTKTFNATTKAHDTYISLDTTISPLKAELDSELKKTTTDNDKIFNLKEALINYLRRMYFIEESMRKNNAAKTRVLAPAVSAASGAPVLVPAARATAPAKASGASGVPAVPAGSGAPAVPAVPVPPSGASGAPAAPAAASDASANNLEKRLNALMPNRKASRGRSNKNGNPSGNGNRSAPNGNHNNKNNGNSNGNDNGKGKKKGGPNKPTARTEEEENTIKTYIDKYWTMKPEEIKKDICGK